MKVLLYGYYDKSNFGDEIFKYILCNYLSNKKIEYIVVNPRDILLSANTKYDIDVILFGGGEIINDYFILPLFKMIKNNNLYNIPILGASIGANEIDIKYMDFFDKCIFRNNLSIIDNTNYFFDNDIIFSLNNYYSLNIDTIVVEKNTIGYYLIDNIDENTMNILKEFTNTIKNNYTINFTVFDKSKDISIINKLIKECCITNYNIIIRSDNLDLVKEIVKNEKHLCLRFHSHVICYLYKLQFLTIPVSKKVKNFNSLYDIKESLTVDDLLYGLDNQNIIFKTLGFDYKILNSFFDSTYAIKDKSKSVWFVFEEIYTSFINIIESKESIKDISVKINYISDQIELYFFNKVDTQFKYGINEKLKILLDKYTCNDYLLQIEFITILTNLNKK